MQVIFGTSVLVMLWLPVKCIRSLLPGFLPYNVMLSRLVQIYIDVVMQMFIRIYGIKLLLSLSILLMTNMVVTSFAALYLYIPISSDSPMSELSLELLLLQVVLPTLLEQGYTRLWLKIVVRYWCIAVAMLLDLRSYLLGDIPLQVITYLFISISIEIYSNQNQHM